MLRYYKIITKWTQITCSGGLAHTTFTRSNGNNILNPVKLKPFCTKPRRTTKRPQLLHIPWDETTVNYLQWSQQKFEIWSKKGKISKVTSAIWKPRNGRRTKKETHNLTTPNLICHEISKISNISSTTSNNKKRNLLFGSEKKKSTKTKPKTLQLPNLSSSFLQFLSQKNGSKPAITAWFATKDLNHHFIASSSEPLESEVAFGKQRLLVGCWHVGRFVPHRWIRNEQAKENIKQNRPYRASYAYQDGGPWVSWVIRKAHSLGRWLHCA